MKKIRLQIIASVCLILSYSISYAQVAASISGKIISEKQAIELASVTLLGSPYGTSSDKSGNYSLKNIKAGKYILRVSCVGFEKFEKAISINEGEHLTLPVDLSNYAMLLNEVVITGTMKEVSRLESPVPVEIYTPTYFKKNPTPNIYEALQNVNGVRPQLNCNVCNTGDIHINGLEGPYTMVLVDGMPIVSSLSTVYGLSGIPNSIVERIEIVKGPASSLYGSEAVGGLINIITKKPQNAPLASADIFSTSWGEYNADLAFKLNSGKKATALTGLNYFNFQNRVDNNKDNFTDMTLQHRISLFQKWNFNRKENRLFSLAARYMYEDRWGGDMRWQKQYRGGDSIYGESIYTNRWEVLGNYQLPFTEKLLLSFSYNSHNQDSRYGKTVYDAQQNIAFMQLTWDKKIGKNDFLMGTALRYTYYDDNTPATATADLTKPENLAQKTWLPGIFVQNEISITDKHKLLLGYRYDYNNYHGNIFTPRLAYKWTFNENNILRFNAGTGYRVVNLFTEDHAALTGARIIEIKNELNPERSYNINANYIKKIYTRDDSYIGLDASAFYTYFTNRIVGDYEIDPNKIIYDNLSGFAESKGISLNIDAVFNNVLKVIVGGTLMENTLTENGLTKQQLLTENFTSTWAISYKINSAHLAIDYTGNMYSPMRLPLLGEKDPRRAYSPWWSIQNIQMTYDGFRDIQIYGGVKNLLNWTPNQGNPFIIARSNDPFDKEVQFGNNGKVIASPNNPYALTFDPNYVYGPNQGIRLFLGIRYTFKK
ncbi:TonB-dependent receptor [Aquirufa ecclesiirivi]|uniref:TonB-dependent receptor n=1 Tax=Aquirufa ecclesiirivi TaxID=2715124 RepID=UPI0022A894A8|nr:TonB-dependent receptor [Aquirufa ecclesiirivi]MCZ2471239.1 TonB-dependent receptor [Aquirufa ecclesiirivi]